MSTAPGIRQISNSAGSRTSTIIGASPRSIRCLQLCHRDVGHPAERGIAADVMSVLSVARGRTTISIVVGAQLADRRRDYRRPGQSGSFGSLMTRNCIRSASYRRNRPTSGSPIPRISLTRLGRLNRSDDPGKHAENPAFGAARDESRRRRLGMQTAIARSVRARRTPRPALRNARCCRTHSADPPSTQASLTR